jgi:hypothetical protein
MCVPSHLCVSGIEFTSFYHIDIWFRNCSEGVVFSPFILFAVIFFSNFRYWYNYICISCVPRNMFSMCKMSLLVAHPPLPLFEVIFLNTKISSQVYVLLSWISCMQNVISERLPCTTLLSLFINPNVLRTQT